MNTLREAAFTVLNDLKLRTGPVTAVGCVWVTASYI